MCFFYTILRQRNQTSSCQLAGVRICLDKKLAPAWSGRGGGPDLRRGRLQTGSAGKRQVGWPDGRVYVRRSLRAKESTAGNRCHAKEWESYADSHGHLYLRRNPKAHGRANPQPKTRASGGTKPTRWRTDEPLTEMLGGARQDKGTHNRLERQPHRSTHTE